MALAYILISDNLSVSDNSPGSIYIHSHISTQSIYNKDIDAIYVQKYISFDSPFLFVTGGRQKKFMNSFSQFPYLAHTRFTKFPFVFTSIFSYVVLEFQFTHINIHTYIFTCEQHKCE